MYHLAYGKNNNKRKGLKMNSTWARSGVSSQHITPVSVLCWQQLKDEDGGRSRVNMLASHLLCESDKSPAFLIFYENCS